MKDRKIIVPQAPAIIMPAPRAIFEVKALRDGLTLFEEEVVNTVMTGGKNDLLDKYFAGSAYTAAWYMGLINNSGFSAIAAGDTMSSHAGWSETASYDESTREAITFASASSGSKASSADCQFTISATVTVNGVFITSNSTKSGTTGILYSAASFSAARSLVDNDVLQVGVTYSV